MASSKIYSTRPKHRFLHTDQSLATDSILFEFDESDIWNNTTTAARALSPVSSRVSRKSTAACGGGPASLPVNVPDWSKILKEEYRENRRESEDFDEDDAAEENGGGDRIPPHEFLARQVARSRIVSFSVHEGVGRTLKGRDLSRVRNAIWQKTGFED